MGGGPDLRGRAWDEAYGLRQNFLFHPNEEVIRFVSANFRKQRAPTWFDDVRPGGGPMRSLDLGCGIGRHVIYLADAGFESFGIDLSPVAVEMARAWAGERGIAEAKDRIVSGSAHALPWPDAHFDCIVSHGTLDSMPFEVARAALREARRVLAPQGLAYVDLISGESAAGDPDYDDEVVLDREHERGTVQSYFSPGKIDRLVEGSGLRVRDLTLARRETRGRPQVSSRYHLVFEHDA